MCFLYLLYAFLSQSVQPVLLSREIAFLIIKSSVITMLSSNTGKTIGNYSLIIVQLIRERICIYAYLLTPMPEASDYFNNL